MNDFEAVKRGFGMSEVSGQVHRLTLIMDAPESEHYDATEAAVNLSE